MICLSEADEIIVLGAYVAQMMDGKAVPVVVLSLADYRRLRTGDRLVLSQGGRLEITPNP
jgi:predicted aconitase with swiveling domain